MSSKPKNKNKNKLPAPGATGSSGAASAAAGAAAAEARPATAAKANKDAPKKAAGAKPAASTSAPSTTPAPAAAARPSLLTVVDDDDDAPLVRGAPRKPAAAAAAAATTTAAAPAAALSDVPAEDVLFGNKRSEKEAAKSAQVAERAAKKRKALASGESTKKKKKGGDDDEAVDLFTGTTPSATLKHLSEPLSHSSLKAGMVLLGAVRGVNEVDLTVQLPHGLTGYVSMREVSDTIADIVDRYIEQGEKAEEQAATGAAKDGEEAEAQAPAINLPNLADFIRVGQLVHCTILSVGENAAAAATKHTGANVSSQKSRRIEISLRAALFNQNLSLASLHDGRPLYGSVKSIQEKGYVVDVGIAADNTVGAGAAASSSLITAFLPFSAAPAADLLPAPKKTGRVKKEDEAAAAADRRLCVGMPISTVITSAQNKRVLVLSAVPRVVRNALVKNSSSNTTGDDTQDDATALRNTIGFTNLQPGMLVKADIESVISAAEQARQHTRMSGLYVRFLDFFHAIVDTLHTSSDASIAGSLESMFRPGQQVTARILYINYAAKKIALSLLPHIVKFEPFVFPRGVKCGDKIMDSIITKIEPKQGIFLRLPVSMEGASGDQERKEAVATKARVAREKAEAKAKAKAAKGSDDQDESMDEEDEAEDAAEEEEEEDVSEELSLSAWAHLSRISDGHITHVPKSMSIGATAPCRILNFHYVDGMVHVSTQPRILEQSILYYEDVQAGMEVQGEIVSVESFGVLLKLTPHITALIPALHLSDVHLSDPSKKFKVGQELKARVLYCEESNKKIICTLKKSLLTSALPQLHSYQQATVGLISHGYIASVKEYGLIVEFYNKTHGLVEASDLRLTQFLKEGQSPAEVFKRGEVHKVRVVHCDQKRKRMKLSLGLVAPKSEAAKAEAVQAAKASIDQVAAPGLFVAATVREVQKDALLLVINEEEDAAAAAVKEEENAGKKGKKKGAAAAAKAEPAPKTEHLVLLPASQLTDHASLASALLKTYPVGHVFPRLLVLHKDKGLKIPIVTLKPSLIAAASETDSTFTLPASYDPIQPGMSCVGFVRAITEFGVFVSFIDHVSALAPRALLSDTFVAGDLNASFSVGQTVRAKVVSVEAAKDGDALPRLTITLKPSQVLEEAQREAALVDTEGAFATTYFAEAVRAGVIDAAPEMTGPAPTTAAAADAKDEPKGKGNKRKSAAPASGSLSRGQTVSVKVERVLKHYVIVSLPSHNGAIGYALAISSNTHSDTRNLFTVGQETRARVVSVPAPSKVAEERMILVIDLVAALADAKAKNKSGASVKKTNLSFVDPALSKLAQLQNATQLQVRIKGVAAGAADATGKLEVEIGTVVTGGHLITGRVHVSELEEPLHQRVAAGDKAAKALVKKGAYNPLEAWAARAGEVVPARIVSIVRKKHGKKQHITRIDVSLRPSTLALPTPEPLAVKPTKAAASKASETPVAADAAAPTPAPLPRLQVSDLKPSQLLQVAVKNVEVVGKHGSHESCIWVVVAPGVKGRLRCNELSFPAEDAAAQKMLASLTDSFHAGQVLTTQVLEVHSESKLVDVVLLPLGSTKPKKLDSAVLERVKAAQVSATHSLQPGRVLHDLTIKKILPESGLLVSFSTSPGRDAQKHVKFGRVHLTDISDVFVRDPLKRFKIGQVLPRAVVLSVRTKEEPVFRGAEAEEDEEAIAAAKTGTQQQVDLSLRASRLPPKHKKAAAMPSSQKALKPQHAEVTDLESLVGREGSMVQGYVRATGKAGCFISLSRDVVARCQLKNLSEGFVADVAHTFPVGRLLPRVRVLEVDTEKRTVEVTLRRSDDKKGAASASTGPDGQPLYSFEKLAVDQVVRGFVTQVKPFGVFIKLLHSPLSGLCHISEVSDKHIKDLGQHYEVGDKVRAKIVKIDSETKKISLGLKAKYFEGLEADSDAEDEAAAQEDEEDEDADMDEDEEADDADHLAIEDEAEENEEDEEAPALVVDSKKGAKKAAPAAAAADSDEEDAAPRPGKKARQSTAAAPAVSAAVDDDEDMTDAPALALDLNSSFTMLTGGRHNAPAAADSEADSDDSDAEGEEDDDAEGESAAKKKSRRAKSAAKKAEERTLLAREHAILDPSAQPESADDYERLLVQDPNSSMVWIKFMAYQISLTEIEKARKIGERALKSISFRAPQEKLNVWVALLNLENMYGTSKTMADTFTRATQYNDPLTIYMEVAKIYAATKKIEQCIETYESALKKFHALPSIWVAYATFMYSQPSQIAAGRELLKRAMQRLDKAEHVALLVKFAQLEFHVAHNVDRGRTLLEGVLSSYPKRIDLWNIYLDMEMKLAKRLAEIAAASAPAPMAKAGKDAGALQLEAIRRLFERITSLSISTKKMKFFFKRYLIFEKTNGADPERIEAVKNKAKQFVASKMHADE